MTTEPADLTSVHDALAVHGLHALGSAPVGEVEIAADDSDGDPTRTLILVGNAGSSMWPAFSASPEYSDGQSDPLDRWSRRIGDHIAKTFGLRVLYPFGGPPHHPFQRWAVRIVGVHPSPLRLQIHPVFGLWHAYRFALLGALSEPAPPVPVASATPCLACAARPCLEICPAGAFDHEGYDANACQAHLRGHPAGDCATQGCAARHACPVGATYRYQSAHAQFHMRAFVAAGLTSA
jgi:hypothetical protein